MKPSCSILLKRGGNKSSCEEGTSELTCICKMASLVAAKVGDKSTVTGLLHSFLLSLRHYTVLRVKSNVKVTIARR